MSAWRLAKSFGQRCVVNDVSFSVARGETVGLLGPNGAGKTTLFSLICGLTPPDRGNVSLDGRDVTMLPMYRRARLGIGYLPQQASIFNGLSVEQNIVAIAEQRLPNRAVRAEHIRAIFSEFKLEALRNAMPAQLSGGERRRVEIARALIGAPEFVLFDEPFAGVDPIGIADVRDLIRRCALWGIGILITDHNVRATLGLVDRALVIHDGSVLAEGRPAEIVSNPRVQRFYLGNGFTL